MGKVSAMIGGEAGFGIMSSGELLAKCLTHGGLYVYTNIEYPSLIRGGHNAIHVTASDEPIASYYNELEVLIALNKDTIDKHIHQMVEGSVVVYDADEVEADDPAYEQYKGVTNFLHIPLKTLSEEAGGAITKNTVAVGAMLSFIGYPFHFIEENLQEIFGRKGNDIVEMNVGAAKSGYDFVTENYAELKKEFVHVHEDAPKRMMITGNQSMAMGLLQGGCKWYSAYPMTPATAILHTLVVHGPQYGLVAKQTEDELAAGLMAIGANYQGVRAACGTSGGGFSLMVEGLGLAAIAETPMVYVNVQRAGPATGLPTWSGQGDLRFVMHASQDEFPRFVLAPGDTQEAFHAAAEAMNLAEVFQVPVIVLSDKNLAEHHQTWEVYDTSYVINRGKLLKDGEAKVDENYRKFKRLEFSDDGISPRVVPGMTGGVHCMASDEQDEYGDITEDSVNRTKKVQKRYAKVPAMLEAVQAPKFWAWENGEIVEDTDPESRDVTLVCWGGTKGPALEACKVLAEKYNVNANILHVIYMWPFHSKMGEILDQCKKTVGVEANLTGQFESVVREQLLRGFDHHITRLDGRPFHPTQLARDVDKVLKENTQELIMQVVE